MKYCVLSLLFVAVAFGVAEGAFDEARARLERAVDDLEAGRYAEAETGLQDVLARIPPGDSSLQSSALCAASRLAWERRRLDDAIRLAREAADAAVRAADAPAEFLARTREMRALYERGRRAEAWALLVRLEARERSTLAPRTAVEFYDVRSVMHRRRGHYDVAAESIQEAIRAGGDLPETILALADRASLENAQRHGDETERCLDEAGRRIANAPLSPFRQACLLGVEADVREDQGRRAEALRLLQAALLLHHAVGNTLREASVRLEIAYELENAGHGDDATRQRRLAFATCLRERDSAGLRAVLEARAWALTRHPDATASHGLIVDLEAALPILGDPADAVWAHLDLAQQLARGSHDFPNAERELTTALALARGARRPDLEVWVEGLWGRLCQEQPAYEVAATHLQRGLEMASALPQPAMDAEEYAIASPGNLRKALASVRLSQSRFEDAAALYRQALQDDADPDKVQNRCQDLQGLALVALTMQDLERAERHFDALLDEIRRLPSPVGRAAWTSIALVPLIGRPGTSVFQFFEDPSVPEGDDSPGRLLMARVARDPARADRLRAACREWVEHERRGSNAMTESIALLVQGFMQEAFGQTAAALDSVAQGLEVARRARLPGNLHLGYYLGTRLLLRQGRLAEAASLARRAVDTLDEPGSAKEQSYYLDLLAALRLRQKDPRGGLAWADRAVERARFSRDGWMVALALCGRGRCLAARGDRAAALGCYREAASVMHERGRSRDEAAICMLEARLQADDRAVACYQKALALLRGSEAVLELRECFLETGRFLEARQQPNAALALYREAIQAVVAWRSLLPDRRGQQLISEQHATQLLFERAIGLLMARHDHAEVLRLLELSHSLELLGSVDLGQLPGGDPAARARIERLTRLRRDMTALQGQVRDADRGGRERLQETLATTRAQFFAALNDIRRTQPDFDQLLTVRATDLAALQGLLPASSLLVEYFPAADALYVLMVTRDAFEIRRVEVPRSRLGTLVRRFRAGVSDPDGAVDSAEFGAANALLYELLVTPLRSAMAGRKQLAVVPAGVLWYLPMEALRDPQGHWLIENTAVVTLSSADVLHFLQGRAPAPAAPRLLAVGDATGTALPGARREIHALLGVLPGARALLGSAATREALRREAPQADILHVASHSTLDRSDPNGSAIQLADGAFRLAEIYGLHLPPSSLVVLSSCQSALGEDNPGRELATLATAFTTAGASTVVASLWRVDDEATADLMTAFYEGLRGGASRSEALRAAQRRLLSHEGTRHPYYWAGFTLLGDPR